MSVGSLSRVLKIRGFPKFGILVFPMCQTVVAASYSYSILYSSRHPPYSNASLTHLYNLLYSSNPHQQASQCDGLLKHFEAPLSTSPIRVSWVCVRSISKGYIFAEALQPNQISNKSIK